MLRVFAFLQKFTSPVRRDERGVTAVEYALLLIGIMAALVVAAGIFGKALGGVFSTFSVDFLNI